MAREKSERLKKNRCLTALLVCLIIMLVIIVGVIVAANVIFNKMVSPMIGDVSLSQVWKIIRNFKKANEGDIVTNPYEPTSYNTAESFDENEVYYEKVDAGYYAVGASDVYSAETDYFLKDGDAYVETNIEAFAPGIEYYIFKKSGYNKISLTSATFEANKYYVFDSGDLGDFYANLKRVLLLKDECDLSPNSLVSIVSQLMEGKTDNNQQPETAASEESEGGSNDQIMKLLEELNFGFDLSQLEDFDHTNYDNPTNLDYTKLPLSDKQLAAFIDEIFSALSNVLLKNYLKDVGGMDLSELELADYFGLSQIIIDEHARAEADKNNTAAGVAVEPGVTVTLRFEIRNLLNTAFTMITDPESAEGAKLDGSNFLVKTGFKLVKSLLPKKLFVSATVYPKSDNTAMAFKINNASEEIQQSTYKIINGVMKLTTKDSESAEGSAQSDDFVNDMLVKFNTVVVDGLKSVENIVPLSFVTSESGVKAELFPLEILISTLKLENVNPNDLLTSLKILGFTNGKDKLEALKIDSDSIAEFYAALNEKYGLTIAGYRPCCNCSKPLLYTKVDGKYHNVTCKNCSRVNKYSETVCSNVGCNNILDFDSDSDGVFDEKIICPNPSCGKENKFVAGFDVSSLLSGAGGEGESPDIASELLGSISLNSMDFSTSMDISDENGFAAYNKTMKVTLSDKALAAILKDNLGALAGEDMAFLKKMDIIDLNITLKEGTENVYSIDLTLKLEDAMSLITSGMEEDAEIPYESIIGGILPESIYLAAAVYIVDNGVNPNPETDTEYSRYVAYLNAGTSIDELCFNGYEDNYTKVALNTITGLIKGLGTEVPLDRDKILATVSDALIKALGSLSQSGGLGNYVSLTNGGIALPSLYELVSGQLDNISTMDVQNVLYVLYDYELPGGLPTGFDKASLLEDRNGFFELINNNFYIKSESKIAYEDIFPATSELAASGEGGGLADKLSKDSILFNPVTDSASPDYNREALYTDTRTLEQLQVYIDNKALASLVIDKLDEMGSDGSNEFIESYGLIAIYIKHKTYVALSDSTVDYDAGYTLQEGDVDGWWLEFDIKANFNKTSQYGSLLPDYLRLTANIELSHEGEGEAKTIINVNGKEEAWANKLFNIIGSFTGGEGSSDSFDLNSIKNTVSSAIVDAINGIKENIDISYDENKLVLGNIYGILVKQIYKDDVTTPEGDRADALELYNIMHTFGMSPTLEDIADSSQFADVNDQAFFNELNDKYYIKKANALTSEDLFPTEEEELGASGESNSLSDKLGVDSILFNKVTDVNDLDYNRKALYTDNTPLSNLKVHLDNKSLASMVKSKLSSLNVADGMINSLALGTLYIERGEKILYEKVSGELEERECTGWWITLDLIASFDPTNENAALLPSGLRLYAAIGVDVTLTDTGVAPLFDAVLVKFNGEDEKWIERLNSLVSPLTGSEGSVLDLSEIKVSVNSALTDALDSIKDVMEISYDENAILLDSIYGVLVKEMYRDDNVTPIEERADAAELYDIMHSFGASPSVSDIPNYENFEDIDDEAFFTDLNNKYYIKSASKLTYDDLFASLGNDLGASGEGSGMTDKLSSENLLFNKETDVNSPDYNRKALYSDDTLLANLKVRLDNVSLAAMVKKKLDEVDVNGSSEEKLIKSLALASLYIENGTKTSYERDALHNNVGVAYDGWWITMEIIAAFDPEAENSNMLPKTLRLTAEVGVSVVNAETGLAPSSEVVIVNINREDEEWIDRLNTIVSTLTDSNDILNLDDIKTSIGDSIIDAINTIEDNIAISYDENVILLDSVYGVLVEEIYKDDDLTPVEDRVDDNELYDIFHKFGKSPTLADVPNSSAFENINDDAFFADLNDKYYIKSANKITSEDLFPPETPELGASGEGSALSDKLTASSIIFNEIKDPLSPDYNRLALYTDNRGVKNGAVDLSGLMVNLDNISFAAMVERKIADASPNDGTISELTLAGLYIEQGVKTYMVKQPDDSIIKTDYEGWWVTLNIIAIFDPNGENANLLPKTLRLDTSIGLQVEEVLTSIAPVDDIVVLKLNTEDEEWINKLNTIVRPLTNSGAGEDVIDLAELKESVGNSVIDAFNSIKDVMEVSYDENVIKLDSIYGVLAKQSSDENVTDVELYTLFHGFGKSPSEQGENSLEALYNKTVASDNTSFVNEVNRDYYLTTPLTASDIFAGNFLGGDISTDSVNFTGASGVYNDTRIILDKNDTNAVTSYEELKVVLWDKALASLLLASDDGSDLNMGENGSGEIKQITIVKREIEAGVFHNVMVLVLKIDMNSSDENFVNMKPEALYAVCEVDLDSVTASEVTDYTQEDLDNDYVYLSESKAYKRHYDTVFMMNDMSEQETGRFFEIVETFSDMSMGGTLNTDTITLEIGSLLYQKLTNMDKQMNNGLEVKSESEYVPYSIYSSIYQEGVSYYLKNGLSYVKQSVSAGSFDNANPYYVKNVGSNKNYVYIGTMAVFDSEQIYYRKISDNFYLPIEITLSDFDPIANEYYIRNGLGCIELPAIFDYLSGEGTAEVIKNRNGEAVTENAGLALARALREFGRSPAETNVVETTGEGGIVYLDNTIRGLNNGDLYYNLQTKYYLNSEVNSDKIYNGTLFDDGSGNFSLGSGTMNLKNYDSGKVGLFYDKVNVNDLSVEISDKQLGVIVNEQESKNKLATAEYEGELVSIRIFFIVLDKKPYLMTQFTTKILTNGYQDVDVVNETYSASESYYTSQKYVPYYIGNQSDFVSEKAYYTLTNGIYSEYDVSSAFTAGIYYRALTEINPLASPFYSTNVKEFEEGVTYYVLENGSYVPVDTAISAFDSLAVYFIKLGDYYYCVSKDNIERNAFDTVYYTKNMLNQYTAVTAMDNFDSSAEYYIRYNSEYHKVTIDHFDRDNAVFVKSESNMLPSALYVTSNTLQRVDTADKYYYTTEVVLNNMSLYETKDLLAYCDSLATKFGTASFTQSFDLQEITDNMSAMIELLMDSLREISKDVSFTQYGGYDAIARFSSDDSYYELVTEGEAFSSDKIYYVKVGDDYVMADIDAFASGVTYYKDNSISAIMQELTENYSTKYANTQPQGSAYVTLPDIYSMMVDEMKLNEGIENVNSYGYVTVEQYAFEKGTYYKSLGGGNYEKQSTYNEGITYYEKVNNSYQEVVVDFRALGLSTCGTVYVRTEALSFKPLTVNDGNAATVNSPYVQAEYVETLDTSDPDKVYYARSLYVNNSMLRNMLHNLNSIESLKEAATTDGTGTTVYYQREDASKEYLAGLALMGGALYVKNALGYQIATSYAEGKLYFKRYFDYYKNEFGDAYYGVNVTADSFKSCYYVNGMNGTKTVVFDPVYDSSTTYYRYNPVSGSYVVVSLEELATVGFGLSTFYTSITKGSDVFYEIATVYNASSTYYSFKATTAPTGTFAEILTGFDILTNTIEQHDAVPEMTGMNTFSFEITDRGFGYELNENFSKYAYGQDGADSQIGGVSVAILETSLFSSDYISSASNNKADDIVAYGLTPTNGKNYLLTIMNVDFLNAFGSGTSLVDGVLPGKMYYGYLHNIDDKNSGGSVINYMTEEDVKVLEKMINANFTSNSEFRIDSYNSTLATSINTLFDTIKNKVPGATAIGPQISEIPPEQGIGKLKYDYIIS